MTDQLDVVGPVEGEGPCGEVITGKASHIQPEGLHTCSSEVMEHKLAEEQS